MSGAPSVANLAARSVRVRHEGTAARTPDGVDVSVAPGEVLLILGPSGCGKSTLALTFNGLVPHAVPARLEGEVLVAGVSTAEQSVARISEHVGMVFQDPEAQLVTTTVLDEVCFGPENRLVPAAEVEERAERALRAVGLWERRDDDPAVLSGGGKQRLAIACALALDAAVLVLDEPTANLDPAGAEEVYRLLGDNDLLNTVTSPDGIAACVPAADQNPDCVTEHELADPPAPAEPGHPGDPAGLASTGSTIGWGALFGAVALLAAGGLLALRRRRTAER